MQPGNQELDQQVEGLRKTVAEEAQGITILTDPSSIADSLGLTHLDEAKMIQGSLSYGYVPVETTEGPAPVAAFDACYIVFTTGTPGTPVKVAHSLGRIPSRFVVVMKSAAEDVFAAGTWTRDDVWFDASVGSVKVTIELA